MERILLVLLVIVVLLGFIHLWRKYKQGSRSRMARSTIRDLFDPAGGRPQSGAVHSLDLRMIVPGQILELVFDLSGPLDEARKPDLILEALSAASEESPAHFRVVAFRRLGWANVDFPKFCEANNVANPPEEIWLLESGSRAFRNTGSGIQSVFMGYFGAKNFLWVNHDVLCRLRTDDGREILNIGDRLRHIHISPVLLPAATTTT